jgi:hypothetical protein
MAGWWKNLRLQARFMILCSLGALGLAACALAAIGWSEFSTLEGNLRRLSKGAASITKAALKFRDICTASRCRPMRSLCFLED